MIERYVINFTFAHYIYKNQQNGVRKFHYFTKIERYVYIK